MHSACSMPEPVVQVTTAYSGGCDAQPQSLRCGARTSSASLKEKRDRSVAMVATRETLARDCPTQLRGPSAKGKYRLGRLLSSAWCTRCQEFTLPQKRSKHDSIAL